jgi:hypothetical protein
LKVSGDRINGKWVFMLEHERPRSKYFLVLLARPQFIAFFPATFCTSRVPADGTGRHRLTICMDCAVQFCDGLRHSALSLQYLVRQLFVERT